MGTMGQKGFLLAGFISVCELTALQAALAEPPHQKAAVALSHGAKGQDRESPRLDLRAPSQTLSAEQAPTATAASNSHHFFGGESPFRSEADPAQAGHIMSPLQNVAHNFRQEGLPIAKLFQSNTSLVHIGLNPKGKPGLWVMHKVH
jgi:hypothetical protein